MLRKVQAMLPTAIKYLKFARKEISAVSATMKSIFTTLKLKGLPLFEQVSTLWKVLFVLYFFFLFPLTLLILLYSFWASGYLGGPPQPKAEDDQYVEPKNFFEKCGVCCASCCACMRSCHDKQLCLWSFLLFFYVVVLLIFIMSIVFCILAGVKIFLGTGCAQIFLLNDSKICTETVNIMSVFLPSFAVKDGIVPLSMTCDHFSLTTCDLIRNRMMTSSKLTVIGSFVATMFSFQLIFETAMLHERLRWRNLVAKYEQDHPTAPGGAGP